METVNELIYTPKGERDYGTLACWGTNSIGKQMEPCLFQVVPAGMYKYKIYIFGSLIRMLSLRLVGRGKARSAVRFPVN